MNTVPENYKDCVIKEIAVNQVAYGKNNPKIAIARDGINGTFYLVDAKDDKVVFAGEAKGPIADATNKIEVYHFDFSSVTQEGEYYIRTPKGRSYTFEINRQPLRKVSNAMVKALYFQRCGCALEEKHAGPFTHGACHTTPAYLVTDPTVIVEDVNCGWHDAGDYGKYVTPANQCIFNLLYAYELFPQGVSDDLNIPETGNGVPDILNEAKYELVWMLKMQAENGGVYHKVSTAEFAGNVMPEDDEHDMQVLSQITITATAGFAGSMAAAYRVFKKFDKDFAEKCLAASKKAFDYAINNYTDHVHFKNIAPVVTGAYGDDCTLDEMYWACAELFRTTGDKYYEQQFAKFYEMDFPKVEFGAYNQSGHGSLCYCLAENADEQLKAKVLNDIVTEADNNLKVANENAYLHAMTDNDYYWGSSAVLTNRLASMVSAAILLKTDKYDNAMVESLSYLLGRNYLSVCYVTGFGSNPTRKPHHRPSMFDKVDDPVPGMVAGGPNDRKGQRPKDSEDLPPAACYIDYEWNWTTNEITIYWNTSVFFISGYLCSKE